MADHDPMVDDDGWLSRLRLQFEIEQFYYREADLLGAALVIVSLVDTRLSAAAERTPILKRIAAVAKKRPRGSKATHWERMLMMRPAGSAKDEPTAKELAAFRARGCADEQKVSDAFRVDLGQPDGPQATHRAARDLSHRDVERVEDLGEERDPVAPQVDTAIVERRGEPMTRPIDRDDPAARREPSHQRRPVGRIAHPTVDQEDRLAGTGLDDLRLAAGPAQPSP